MNHPYRTAPPQPKRSWWARVWPSVVTILVMSPIAACTWFSKPENTTKVIKSVLDVTQTACVLVQDWTDDESWIAKQCDIADDYLPEVRKLVSARKKAAAMKASMKPADGGVGHD